MSRVVICCGVGGAGKTTTAAALGLAHARAGSRTVVLTIDPARRLADALGITHLGNEPREIALPAGIPGRLHALMLDRKATWDTIIRSQAPDEATANKLLANRYYRALSERLTGGHEYMATEKLHALVRSGDWDVVIVDTPPSQHALDFFRAPDRIRRILDQRLIGALLRPSAGIIGMATRQVVKVVRRLAGDAVLDDLTEFFELVSGLSSGLQAHGAEVQALLASSDCTYLVVVHTPAPRLEETLDFVAELRQRALAFGGCVANRYTAPLPQPADALQAHVEALPLQAEGAPAVRQHLQTLVDRAMAAHADADAVVQGLTSARPLWTVPDLGSIEDLDGLMRVAAYLPPEATPRVD